MGFRVLPHVLVGGAALCLASGALASDGVIEINQAKAVAGNVTAMDNPGFPVSLNAPGSYRLTGNLNLSDAGAPATSNGIVIGADNVTIDLNGFTIRGVLMGSGTGILGIWQRARVENGVLEFFGGGGVNLVNGTVRDLLVHNSGVVAIQVQNGIVSGSSVSSTSGDGIWVSVGLIEGCTAQDSFGGSSFRLGTGTLRGSASTGNNTDELECDFSCAMSQNYLTCTTAADCYGGAGSVLQVPPASNMCSSFACP